MRLIKKVRKNWDCEIYNVLRWFIVFGFELIVIFFKKLIIMFGYFLKIIYVYKWYNLLMI